MDVTFRSEEVLIKKHYVNIDGMEVEFGNLYDLMSEIDCGDVVVTDKKLGNHLIQMNVLKSLGNRRWYTGAEKGEKFDTLMDSLENHMEIHYG